MLAVPWALKGLRSMLGQDEASARAIPMLGQGKASARAIPGAGAGARHGGASGVGQGEEASGTNASTGAGANGRAAAGTAGQHVHTARAQEWHEVEGKERLVYIPEMHEGKVRLVKKEVEAGAVLQAAEEGQIPS